MRRRIVGVDRTPLWRQRPAGAPFVKDLGTFLTVPLPPPQHGGVVNGPWHVAVDAGHIYWLAGEAVPEGGGWGYVGRANLDGSGAEPSFIKTEGSLGIAVDNEHIYWSEGYGAGYGSIGRANLDGSGVERYFIAAGEAFGIAVDRAHIYWAAPCSSQPCTGGAIGRANLDGSGVQRSFISGPTAPVSVAVGGGHVYWTDLCSSWREACSSGDTIGRANLDGSGVQRRLITVARTNMMGGLAVYDAHVYWSGSPKSTILALRVTPHTFTLTGRLVNGRCVAGCAVHSEGPLCGC